MGTTGTAIAADDGFDYQTVVLIEGYENAITDGPTAAVVTALSGTEWSAAIGGLSVNWDLEQQLDPWAPEPDVSSISFSVMDVNADEFGIAAFGTARGFRTLLNGDIDCNDTTVTVLSTAAFASSGTIHIDTEAITYSGKTGTTFTGCTRGRYSPLKASSEANMRFGKPHANGTISGGVTLPTAVTSVQSTWPGRAVAIYLLRRTGSTLDVIAQGQRVWAGRIAGIRDEANGLAIVECEDGRSWFRDCVLLRDQWRARIAEGVYLRPGLRFEAWDAEAASRLDANDLVVTTSASGDNEIEAGITTLQDLSNALNNWLLAEKVAARLNMFWRFDPQISTDDGSRSRFSWSGGSSSDVNRVYIKCSDPHVWNFLGWGMVDFVREDWEESSAFEEISPGPPHRVYLHGSYGTFPVVDELGTFWDNQPYAPADGGILASASGTWGFVQFDGGIIAPAEKNGTNILPTGYGRPFLNAIAGASSTVADLNGLLMARKTVDEEGDITVRQVAIVEGTMTTLLTRFLASTGTSTYNGTYDVFPEQLGAAMPWAVLGTNWIASTDNLAEGQANQIVVIEKSTRLVDKFGGELAARLASVQWKDEGYQAVTWCTPSAATYEHTFTEQSKFASDKEQQALATVANETDKFLCTLLKVEYNRVLSGGYKSTDMIHDAAAARASGKEKARTISLPNIYGPPVGGGTGSLEALLDGLKAIVPLFSKPLRLLRRKIGLNHFEGVAPGDQCLISDNHARDPATGERGLNSKPGIIMGVRVDWGGYETDAGGTRDADGEVDIVISPRDRVSRYSPCAEVDFSATNAGYDAGTRTLTTRAHQHSNSGAAVDASRFVALDEVVIVEIDPDTAASPTSWERIVESVSGNDIVLTVALSSPAWDSAKRYRIISNTYVNAVATQQADVYQADDADGLINDDEQPYEYGYNAGGANTWAADDSVQYGRLHATSAYGDAVPLDTGYEQDIAKLANALCWGRTAISMPYLTRSVMGYVDAGIVRQILAVIPIHLGPAKQFSDVDKWLNVSPWLRRATGGADVDMLVSLCRHPPAGSSKSITDVDAPGYVLVGPYETATWSTGSATWALGDVHQFDTKMVDPYSGIGYLVIEGESNLETRGLAQCSTSLPDL